MSESEDWSHFGLRRRPAASYSQASAPVPRLIAFSRLELNTILQVYGRKVAEGTWRDYAIDHHADRAVFSIYRRTSEYPLYRVEKVPALARRQGAFRLVAAGGAILKRGQDLAAVMRFFERPKLSLVR